MDKTDIAVVGAGIVGLAFAHAYAKQGQKVTVFDRSEFAVNASVRNFGLIWPVGQSFGPLHDRAIRSREIWLAMIQRAQLWHRAEGSLHLAYADDEMQVLREYTALPDAQTFGRKLISPEEAIRLGPIREKNLKGALLSPTEMNVDPREAIRKIPSMLSANHGVDFHFGVNVTHAEPGAISTSIGTWKASEIVICSGTDFETLFPAEFALSGLTRCKLQMMRTLPQPQNWQHGPSLCGGLTLVHNDAFRACPSIGELQRRFREEMPFHHRFGIHVLISQTASGELTIGDSHEYGHTLEPFDREDINAAILDYARTFAVIPKCDITERWNGCYSKLPGRSEFISRPAPGVTIVTGLGGAGMTLSFGLAEEIVASGKPPTTPH